MTKVTEDHSRSDESNERNEILAWQFSYAEVHGNLKFILNTPVKNWYVIDFKAEEDIIYLIFSLWLNADLADEDYREHEN